MGNQFRLYRSALCLTLLATFSIPATAAIIGTDDRKEWFQETQPILKDLGRSVAIIIQKKEDLISPEGTGFKFNHRVKTHAEYDNLCSDVAFANQPAPGVCSSFLVGPDLVITANHCLKASCSGVEFVFDFLYSAPGKLTTHFEKDQLFQCAEVVEKNEKEDWALLRLDHKTVGRSYFKPRESGELAMGDPVQMMGFPRGIPLKIAGNAKVVPSQNSAPFENYFEADLDSFGGNSGGPVVNPSTGQLEGILVVAFGEFEEDNSVKPMCHRLRTYTDPAEAAPVWVLKATLFAEAVKKWLNPGKD